MEEIGLQNVQINQLDSPSDSNDNYASSSGQKGDQVHDSLSTDKEMEIKGEVK